jgi:hypothetical protein
MRVNHGGGYIAVAQQLLHRANGLQRYPSMPALVAVRALER